MPLLLLVVVMTGCGDERVVSNYKPVPKAIAATVELPTMRYPEGPPPNMRPIELPANKRFLLTGSITGVAPFEKKVGAALMELHPVRDAKNAQQTSYASAFLDIEFLTDDILKYTATIEPVNRTGEMEVWIQLNLQEPVVTPAQMRN